MRLDRLEIENFKGIDGVTLDFPAPGMRADPDIFVMGSCNGLGKTSILEACALLFLAVHSREKQFDINRMREISISLSDLFVRAGAENASIVGNFSWDETSARLRVILSRDGSIKIDGDVDKIRKFVKAPRQPSMDDLSERFYQLLAGYNHEPIIMQPCLYFHSYRKVQEGSPELGMMVEPDRIRRWATRTPYGMRMAPVVSTFKMQILRAMMGKANLFERIDNENADETLERLNGLMQRYAGGRVVKLRPSQDNTVDLRITSSRSGESFAFDGLSSGQKEIISTLFLIWHYTREQPAIVMIDEPELHLNVEWHRDFVQQVFKLAPDNQYLVATHSEDIFKSVDEDRRLFLRLEGSEFQETDETGMIP